MRPVEHMGSISSEEEEKDSASEPLTYEQEEPFERGDYGDALGSDDELLSMSERRAEDARLKAVEQSLAQAKITQIIEEAKKEKRDPDAHMQRVERQVKRSEYREPRSESIFHSLKDSYDCITLRLERLPYDPATIKGENRDLFKTIFGTRRDFGSLMSALSSDKVQSLSALAYLSLKDKSIAGIRWREALKLYNKHKPEWLHTIADCLGGPISIWNGGAAGHGANTQMLAIESAIRGLPGIGIEVSAYTRPDTRIAEWFEYTVFAFDKKGKPIPGAEPIKFIIDARTQWYALEEWTKDLKKVHDFLDQTQDKRSELSSIFELPEITSLRLIDGEENIFLLRGQYLEEGPVFARLNKEGKITLVSTDDGNIFPGGIRGHSRYEGYRKRMLELYPFHKRDIMQALEENDFDSIQALLKERNYPLDLIDRNGNNILHYAAKFGNTDLIKSICAIDEIDLFQENFKGQNALHLAALHGHLDAVQILIKISQLDVPDKDSNTLLHLAMHSRNPELIEYLCQIIEINATNSNGETPLHIAARLGWHDIIPLLIKYEADVNAVNNKGETPAHIAARFNRAEFLAELIENKANLTIANSDGDSALHIAAKYNSVDAITEILNGHGINPDIINLKNGNTALHIAAEFGQSDAIRELCDKKANVNAINFDGDRPVHIAAIFNQGDAILTLFENDADMNAFNFEGFTALHIAAQQSHLDALQALILSKVNLNLLTDINNIIRNTALHIAAQNGDANVLRILIAAKADQEIINEDFTIDPNYSMIYIPKEWARKHGKEDVYDEVLQHLDDNDIISIDASDEDDEIPEDDLGREYSEKSEISSGEEDDQHEFEGYGSPAIIQSVLIPEKKIAQQERWYTTDDMNLLLDHYLGTDPPDVAIIAPIDAEHLHGDVLADNLSANLELQFTNGYIAKHTISTINFGNRHWAALIIERNDEDSSAPNIYFIDSLGKSLQSQQLLTEIISKSRYSAANLIDLSQPSQQDSYTCGSWAVAQIESLLETGQPLGQDFDIQARRTQDDQIIARNRLMHIDDRAPKSPKKSSSDDFSSAWSSSKSKTAGFKKSELKVFNDEMEDKEKDKIIEFITKEEKQLRREKQDSESQKKTTSHPDKRENEDQQRRYQKKF